LAEKLKDITKKVRQNEEEYMAKYKEFYDDDKDSARHLFNSNESNQGKQMVQNFLDPNNDVLKQRDQEINNLVSSIKDLNEVFKDLSSLVYEQGTILDRIDFNIEMSLENTKKANKHLIQTEKNLDSNCSRNSIIFLIILIFVESILILLKFR